MRVLKHTVELPINVFQVIHNELKVLDTKGGP